MEFARVPYLNLTLIHTPVPRFARWHERRVHRDY
jgi:hypothetical protein